MGAGNFLTKNIPLAQMHGIVLGVSEQDSDPASRHCVLLGGLPAIRMAEDHWKVCGWSARLLVEEDLQ